MEPFQIRTNPARLPPFTIVSGVFLVGLAVCIVWIGAQTTVQAGRMLFDDPWQNRVPGLLLVVAYGLAWIFLRTYGPVIQVVCMYLLRDRGKQVVAFRLDESGLRHVVAGTGVVIPWEGMTVAVAQRTDDQYHVRVTSDGPFAAARDPFSRQLRRTLRKEGGLTIPMTEANPAEEELASAIAQQSAGRVALTR
jgi:hypothetical protein